MKRKTLIKRGLAAVLSAAMALTLAPDVGLFCVPEYVKAEASSSYASTNGIGSIKAYDKVYSTYDANSVEVSANIPDASSGAYYDYVSDTTATVFIDDNDSDGIVLVPVFKGTASGEGKKVIVVSGSRKKGKTTEASLSTAALNEVVPTVVSNGKAVQIKTANADPTTTYSFNIAASSDGEAVVGDELTIKVIVGHTVTYELGRKDAVAGSDFYAKSGQNVTKNILKKVYDPSIIFPIAVVGGNAFTVAAPNTALYSYKNFKDETGKEYKAGDKIDLKSDLTLTPDWKKVVAVDANKLTADQKKKTYDGTKSWSAELTGTAGANDEGKRDVPVVLSTTLRSADVSGTNTSLKVDGVVKDTVSDKDDYLVTVSNDSVDITVEPIKLTKANIDMSDLVIEKVYDKATFNANGSDVEGLSVKYDGKIVAALGNGTPGDRSGQLDITASSVKSKKIDDYLAADASNTANAGTYTDVEMEVSMEANANYIFDTTDGKVKLEGLTGTIKPIEKVVDFGTVVAKTSDVSSVGDPALVVDDLTRSDEVNLLTGTSSIWTNTGANLADNFEIVYGNNADSALFSVKPTLVTQATPSESNDDTLSFTLDQGKVTAANIEGEKTITINVVGTDRKYSNYNVRGYYTIILTSRNLITVNIPSCDETYGEPVELEYNLTDGVGTKVTTSFEKVTKITYYDEAKNDVTAKAEAGTLDAGKDYTVEVVVDGDGSYGKAVEDVTITAADESGKNFEISTDTVYYDGEKTEEPTVKLADPNSKGFVLNPDKEVPLKLTYSTKTADGANAVEFADIIKEAPEEDTQYYVYVNDVKGLSTNYTITGTELEKPITLKATDTRIDIKDATVTGVETSYEATGEAIKPEIKVSYDGKDLVEGTDYSVEYGENKETSGTVTITGLGDYKGTKTITFAITAKTDDQEEAKKAAAEAAQKYIDAAAALPQTKDAVTDTAKADSDIAAAKALAPTDAQMALLDDETKAKVAEAAAQIAKAEKAVADKKADDTKEEGKTDGTTTGSSADVTPSDNNSGSGSGSGGSGGGGGSSNAKTVKNADGSTTTTTTTAKGTIETTTKTNADGSKTTSKVVKNKDGSGSVTETSVSAAGTTKVVEVITDTTGAATEVTTTVSNAKGASMKVTYAAKGTAITVSKVETTGKTAVSIPATVKVGGKTYKVTKIAASALKGNKEITKVTLGKNVKAIGKNAFNGDSKLKTIVMKKAPTTVGKNAFKGIAKKATIKIKATKKAFKTAKTLIKKSGVAGTVSIKRVK